MALLPFHAESARPSLAPVLRHARRGFETTAEYLLLKATDEKNLARRLGIQFGAAASLGAFALVWAELALYLALAAAMAPYWAALIALTLNAGALGATVVLTRKFGTKPSIERQAQEKREEAAHELKAASEELSALKDEVVDSARELVHAKLVVPYERYRMPVATVGAFVAGLVLARLLVPTRSPAPVLAGPGRALYEGDVRGLI